ncbi:MAG: hypothetical protein QF893_25285, partial [Alphaproteobacteria bacterium]|nr:hypothetical protein [Alphaproteobacteria bacterium]
MAIFTGSEPFGARSTILLIPDIQEMQYTNAAHDEPYTRECLAILVARQLKSDDVLYLLAEL